MICQTPLNILVRQGHPAKLNFKYRDGLLFKDWERSLEDYYFIKKYSSNEMSTEDFSTSGSVLIYLSPFKDLEFH